MIKLIRPTQWIKNLFVFGPIVFGGALLNGHAMLSGLITFVAFNFATSSICCFDNIIDVLDDRRNPERHDRPIASGTVTVAQAYGLMLLLLMLSMACMPLLIWVDWTNPSWQAFSPNDISKVFAVILFYWLLNLAC